MSNDAKKAAEESAFGHYDNMPPNGMPPNGAYGHPGYNPYAACMGHMPYPPPPPYYGHPGYHHPAMMPPPPPYWPGYQPDMPAQNAHQPAHPLAEQAQAMVENALGEDAGMFKELLGTLGINDREFWKGAMIGAAAALLLGNENVRGKLLEMLASAGSMLKGAEAEASKSAANNNSEEVR
ncbi:hypothetical protein [Endozoicomonas sp. GU-1]|uniref:hypothetical protein n=1 Tax=Endozoicomonas sp. GU-1 TaxID=3009078 RepID=UPI0022B5402F|nr:hypothetical protein [Endozoicomonas sp. GU-1]WBA84852.1 hypothetical protein O3276_16420 [Endozoicomonas sp. GU-1]